MGQWWLDALPEELDQGNLFEGIPFTSHREPVQPLISTTLRGGVTGWSEHAKPKLDGNGVGHFLHHGPIKHGMVLNHGCDIDKPQSKRLIVIPVFPLIAAPKEMRDHIQNQALVAMFYLPDVPDLGDAFADFRIMQSVPRSVVESSRRLAAMTEESKHFLGARLVTFFLRKELADVEGAPAATNG